MNKFKILKVIGAITLTVAALGGIAYAVHKFKEYSSLNDVTDEDFFDDEEDDFFEEDLLND